MVGVTRWHTDRTLEIGQAVLFGSCFSLLNAALYLTNAIQIVIDFAAIGTAELSL